MLGSVLAVLTMTASALGGGLFVLRLARPSDDVDPLVRLASAFVLGIGVLGWLGFFCALFGLLGPVPLTIMLAIPLLGLLCRDAGASAAFKALRRDGTSLFLLALLALVVLLNLVEGLAPPIDGDSLTYHFELPKVFLREGHLVFVPMAVESAIPLLLHMTYMAALGTGGETALTLWTMVSGWAAGFLLFAVCRVYVSGRWALALALVFQTTPAVVYVAGCGQIEVRTAAFALAAAYWALRAARTGGVRPAVAAGLAAGFFAASKYTGLLFVAAAGLGLLVRGRRLNQAAAFGAAVVAAGFQWYAWNGWNSGDPLFPALYGILPYHADAPWSAEALAALKAFFLEAEKPVPANPWWLVAYPFAATLAPLPAFESLRVGFGPFILLLLPLAVAAAWARRRTLWRGDLLFYVAVCFAAYALWFFLGPSLRLRHLLPLYPLLIVAVGVAAIRGATLWPALRMPLIAAIGLTLLIQVGGQGLFSLKYVQRVVHGETRDDFLRRTVPGFEVVSWVNRNLPADAHLMSMVREIVYLFDVPTFMANPMFQMEVELQAPASDPGKMWRQMRKKGVTHVLSYGASGVDAAMEALQQSGCAARLRDFRVRALASRTLQLPEPNAGTHTLVLDRLTPDTCTLARSEPRPG